MINIFQLKSVNRTARYRHTIGNSHPRLIRPSLENNRSIISYFFIFHWCLNEVMYTIYILQTNGCSNSASET